MKLIAAAILGVNVVLWLLVWVMDKQLEQFLG